MDKVTALKEHLEFKKTSVSSKSKLEDIERYLKRFLNSTEKSLDKITEKELVNFLNSLDFKINTLNGVKFYIKVFIKWYYADWSLRFRNLDKICRTQESPKTYTSDQMLSFEDIKKIVNGERDLMYKTYWSVFFYGGFRPSECCRLKWEQVYFEPEGAVIKIRTTKTGKDFIKSLPKESEHLLKDWRTYNHSEFLFPSPITNSSIKPRSICARLKHLSKKVLGKAVVPYQLRHSIATILYGDDARKDETTAQQMGHVKSMKKVYSNLNETQIKTKARSLWIKAKPLTPEEKDEIKRLKEMIKISNQGYISVINLLFESSKNQKEKDRIKELQQRYEDILNLSVENTQ